ncbi:hypothetical protein [Fredinandcohnia sp. 179-A 10B2 NHS]|uniref:hypothetical protein n=1 Tax=Fredinandcohnia sp. 179-A 10B2 NHS TaxID=3235176 RepID=UPI0039A10C9E
MKKFSFFAVLLFLVMVVSACGSDSESASVSEDGVLTLGETGLFKTDKGEFEVTLDEIKYEAGGDGEKSLRGTYIVANATVTSRAAKAVNIEDVLPFKIYVDDVVNWNNVSVGKEYSFGTQIAGEIKEGESVTGSVIFDARESETYTIILGGKTNPNKLVWELTPADFK